MRAKTTLAVSLVVGVAVAVAGARRANAQPVTYDGCVAYGRMAIPSVRNDLLPDVAQATTIPTPNGLQPIIYYNPIVLSWLQRPTRLFFYAHECGHHVLDHQRRNFPPGHEQEADCWAIRTLVTQGLLSDDDVSVIQQDIARAGRADWTHLPGGLRAINLRRCLR